MIKLPVPVLSSIFVAILSLPASGLAQRVNPGVANVADREVARRQAQADRATKLIQEGDALMAKKDYEAAVTSYKGAFDRTPNAASSSALRATALAKFSDASVKLARQRIQEGRYADARTLCEMVLDPANNPGYRPAISLMANLEDPTYFNQTVGPKFIGKVQDVKKYLNEAQGYYDSGQFDLALKRTDQVLGMDPYNIAARRLQQTINKARLEYADEAYDETRTRAIWAVENGWQSPVRKYGSGKNVIIEQQKTDVAGTSRLNAKLARIIIPQIQFRDATIREAIDFLKIKSRELDSAEVDAGNRGVNIVLKLEGLGGGSAPATPAAPAAPVIPGIEAPAEAVPAAPVPGTTISPTDARITLALSNIPLGEALKYVASLAGLKVKVEPYAVAIVPLSEPTDIMITKEYRVSPGFISSVPAAASGANALGAPVPGGAGGGDATGAGKNIATRQGAKEALEAAGVVFPPGASAYYLASSSKLIVRNTQEAMDQIDILVDSDNQAAPKQVEIESKFVEITQTKTKELGFDWLMGAANAPGSDRVFVAGGTQGNQLGAANADFPFVAPGASNPVGGNPLTGGLRSGTHAITGSAIDALLFNTGAVGVAPSVLGVAGVFTDPQFQVVIRALNQMKGVDLLSAPRVTTKSGQRAVIEIIREFRYPTEFDPPQVPQATNGTFSPITPTTPTTFETRNTGVTLEVEPVVGPDGYTIDLNIVPQVVEFEGFINYGSPIFYPDLSGLLGGVFIPASQRLITENTINQPIFSSRKLTTSVSLWDGQTVALGGLIREDVQKVNDKVPLIGDLPIIGRAFRSSVDQHIKRNLTIFVTARLINPAGQAMNAVEEEEETVDSTINPENFKLPPPEISAPMPK